MADVLIVFRSDWADEFYCEQMVLVEDSSVEYINSVINAAFAKAEARPRYSEVYFGTNEFFTLGETKRDKFVVSDISNEPPAVKEFLKKYLCKGYGSSFGTGIITNVLEMGEEPPEDDD